MCTMSPLPVTDKDGRMDLRFSIFTATVVTVSAEHSPYAVALTTFPKAPEPRVLPGGAQDRKFGDIILEQTVTHTRLVVKTV